MTTKTTSVKVGDDLLAQIRAKAKTENRTIKAELERAIKAHLRPHQTTDK